MSPLIEQTLEWARSQIKPPSAEGVTEQRRDQAALVARVLRGADGPALLELFAQMSVLKPALDVTLHGAASHDYAQRRIGENLFFQSLIHLMDLHDVLQEGPNAARTTADRPVWGWPDARTDGGDEAGRYAPETFDSGGVVAGA